MTKLNILNELIVYLYYFVSTIDKILIRKSLSLQDLSSKQIRIHLNNLLLDPRLWENVSSFHPNDKKKISRAYLQRFSCQPFNHDSLKEKLVEHCIDLIPISLNNTKYWLEHIIKKDDAFFFYCYLFMQDFGNWMRDQ